jgi:CheY-like chemotaxis protein
MSKNSYILLADDDADDRSFVEEALVRNAFKGTIKPAANGIELMEQLQEAVAPASSDKTALPHLILLDLNMPFKDGYDVLREIKQHPDLKSIPVLVLTSSLRSDDETRCRQLGCDKFFQKPLSLTDYDRLAVSILSYMGNRSASC